MLGLVGTVGRTTILVIMEAGRMQMFLFRAIVGMFSPPFRWRTVVEQIHFMGVRSWLVILLTAVFSGMVLAYQGYYTLRQFGSEGLLGSGVALSLVRELGPVLAALMVTGRGGSAMAAELGIMRITEQIDALVAMNLEPIKFLAAPRILATALVLPTLGGIFVMVGIGGAYVIGVGLLDINPGLFYNGMIKSVGVEDLFSGFLKTVIFGVTIGLVSCYRGFNTEHGAKGVGRATTDAVVMSSVLIMVWDYILTSILF